MEWLVDETETETLGTSVKVDNLGCLTVVGAFRGNLTLGLTTLSSSSPDVFCCRYNQKGVLEWAIQLNTGYSPDSPLFLCMDENNNYYVVFSDNSNKLTVSYVKRFGQIMWTKSFIDTDTSVKNYYAYSSSILYIISSIADQVTTDREINNKSVVFKLDSDGNYIWSKGIDSTSSMVYEEKDTVIVVGIEDSKLFVITMTKQGYSEDIYYFPGEAKVSKLFDMKIDNNQNIIILALSEDEDKILTILFDKNCSGNIINTRDVKCESGIESAQILIDDCDMFEYIKEIDKEATIYKNNSVYLTFKDNKNNNYPIFDANCNYLYVGGNYLYSLEIGNGDEVIYNLYGRDDQTGYYFVQMIKV